MAICGGLLGLFLGLSTMTMFQFIYRLTFHLYRMIQQSNSKNAVEPFQRNISIKHNIIYTINTHYRM